MEVIRGLYKHARGRGNPLVISNDADSVWYSPHYLEQMLREVDEDMIAGDIGRHPLSHRNVLYDFNLIASEIDRELRSGMIHGVPDPLERTLYVPSGSNSAFRLNGYVGYRLDQNRGDDSAFGNDMHESGKRVVFLRGAEIYTDGRRVISAFNQGKFYHEQWESWCEDGKEGREQELLEAFPYEENSFSNYVNAYFANWFARYRIHYAGDLDPHECVRRANKYLETMVAHLNERLSQTNVPPIRLVAIPIPPPDSVRTEKELIEHMTHHRSVIIEQTPRTSTLRPLQTHSAMF
jgi:hypothetical protein